MASNSKAKWSNLIGWVSVGILQYEPLPWKRSVPYFSLSREIQAERNTNSFLKAEFNFLITTAQLLQAEFNFTHKTVTVQSSLMKDEDYGTFTKRKSVRSLKETIPYNTIDNLLTSLARARTEK